MFESVDARTDARTNGRRLDYHPISSPCEPSAQVRHRLFWFPFVTAKESEKCDTELKQKILKAVDFGSTKPNQNIDSPANGEANKKGTRRQLSGKCAIRKKFPLQKPKWENRN